MTRRSILDWCFLLSDSHAIYGVSTRYIPEQLASGIKVLSFIVLVLNKAHGKITAVLLEPTNIVTRRGSIRPASSTL